MKKTLLLSIIVFKAVCATVNPQKITKPSKHKLFDSIWLYKANEVLTADLL